MGQEIEKKLKRYHLLLIISVCGLFASCMDNRNFTEFHYAYISYEIYPNKKDIIRIVRTDNNAQYELQLFDKYGKCIADEKVANPYSYTVTNCVDNSLKISYVVGKSDLEMFLVWFKNYKFNPKKIGHYNLKFSYKIRNVYALPIDIAIDSFIIDKKSRLVSLLLKGKIVRVLPVHSLLVYNNSFRSFDDSNTDFYRYMPSDTTLIKKYLQDVIRIL